MNPATISPGRRIVHELARLVGLPSGAGLARIIVERNAMSFRRQWMSFVSGFAEPFFYLFSLGIGVGALVHHVTTDAGNQVSYAAFVAPAMLASAAMNSAVADSTYNFFFKLKYDHSFEAMLATRIGPRDIALGEMSWSLLRGSIYSLAFLILQWAMGLVHSPWGILALPAATFTAFCFSAIGMYATTFMRSWVDFDFIVLVIQPLFLLSASFFPLATYPQSWRWLVELTPFYHGVALCRALTLGEVSLSILWHVAYLAGFGLLGLFGVSRRLDRLLRV